jgi:PAS domain-containing protein
MVQPLGLRRLKMHKKYHRELDLATAKLEETLENTPIREYLRSLTDTKIHQYVERVWDTCFCVALLCIPLEQERERRSQRPLPPDVGPIVSTDERGRPIKRNNRLSKLAGCELDECIARIHRLGRSILDENRIYFEEAQRRTESWKARGGDQRSRPACALTVANCESIADFMGFNRV